MREFKCPGNYNNKGVTDWRDDRSRCDGTLEKYREWYEPLPHLRPEPAGGMVVFMDTQAFGARRRVTSYVCRKCGCRFYSAVVTFGGQHYNIADKLAEDTVEVGDPGPSQFNPPWPVTREENGQVVQYPVGDAYASGYGLLGPREPIPSCTGYDFHPVTRWQCLKFWIKEKILKR